jgi:hypothetical protein
MDVAEWLRELGLEQYAPAFRANDIDGEVLRRLTGEDLGELGVTSIGHRRRLVDAIGALGDRQQTPEASLPTAPALSASGEAERRQPVRSPNGVAMFAEDIDLLPVSTVS